MPIGDQTNQLYRKEYFVDASRVLSAGRNMAKRSHSGVAQVLHASTVDMADHPVVVHGTAQVPIRVDPVREGTKIVGLRVVCSCGRTAELKVQYEG